MAPPRRSTRRVLFLHPKTLIDSWPFPVDTLGEVIKAPSAVYPVLGAAIADLPVQIEMFDGYVAREPFRQYKARLARADILAISMMSPLKALDTEVTIRLARALNPDVTIVLGGNHASAFPERWIEAGADYVVTGEGERASLAGHPAMILRRKGAPYTPATSAIAELADDHDLPHFRSRSTPPHTPAVMVRPASQHSLITGQPWHKVTAMARISARSDNHISPSISAHRVRRPRAARSRSAWVS